MDGPETPPESPRVVQIRRRKVNLSPASAGHVQNKSIMVLRVRRIAGCLLCLELDRQLIRLYLDADDVAADEVAVFTFCGIPEMLADGPELLHDPSVNADQFSTKPR